MRCSVLGPVEMFVCQWRRLSGVGDDLLALYLHQSSVGNSRMSRNRTCFVVLRRLGSLFRHGVDSLCGVPTYIHTSVDVSSSLPRSCWFRWKICRTDTISNADAPERQRSLLNSRPSSSSALYTAKLREHSAYQNQRTHLTYLI